MCNQLQKLDSSYHLKDLDCPVTQPNKLFMLPMFHLARLPHWLDQCWHHRWSMSMKIGEHLRSSVLASRRQQVWSFPRFRNTLVHSASGKTLWFLCWIHLTRVQRVGFTLGWCRLLMPQLLRLSRILRQVVGTFPSWIGCFVVGLLGMKLSRVILVPASRLSLSIP